VLAPAYAFAQSDDPWIRFEDKATELYGFKDLKGNVRVPARFTPFIAADSFYNIIAVNDGIENADYYLLKNGRRVGKDSVYYFDFTMDCEQEGKILFKDRKKDRVGFFDKNGRVVIPAVYNAASPFNNGCALALRNAKRKCWDGHADTVHCEHLGWEGGETVMINDRNEVLANSIKVDRENHIDWYSKRTDDPAIDTSIYLNIVGTNGHTYSFIDFEKEFIRWFHDHFLQALNGDNARVHLGTLCFSEVTYWSERKGWTSLPKHTFLKKFRHVFSEERFQETALKKISIMDEGLNQFIFEKLVYRKFYNACGEHNKERFPAFDVMLNYYRKRLKPLQETPPGTDWKLSAFERSFELDYQEHFEFLKTEEGYKLLSISLKR